MKAVDRGAPVELTGTDLDGEEVDLAELRGRPVVVNVWASWCPPCIVEQPDLNAAAAELGDEVAFVGLNIRDASTDDAKAYVRDLDVPYASIYSADGAALLPFAGTLTPRSIPSTVVLDGEGRIAASVNGRIPTTQTLVSLVEAVLDE
ncbi:TlpA family protein disulfide reductase [Nocardioides xinjiangensis]|uniref:TlpA family protein disulfide reductase n=1 Tax=Nocardioides xinjiangensis TaxID=2817376 RepID=UPI0027DBFECB|nr:MULTISPECIES: TlpA disulfide reductase family protein [unclassified Nocardioides]